MSVEKTREFFTFKPHQGKNVRNVREALEYKQQIVADACNTTVKKISELENQAEITDENLLKAVAEFLDISIEWIRTHNVYEGVIPYEHNEFIAQDNGIINQAQEITNNNIPIGEYTKVIEERLADKELIGELKTRIKFLEEGKIG